MLINIDIDKIHPDPDQPRKTFDKQKVKELTKSFDTHGIIHPLKVRHHDSLPEDEYMVVVGEYRWRAAKERGDTKVEVTLEDLTDEQARLVQFKENYHRTDIPPLQQWKAWDEYIKREKISGSEFSRRTGIPITTVNRGLRTLHNSDNVVSIMLSEDRLSVKSAHAISGISDKNKQVELANQTEQKTLKRKEVEEIARKVNAEPTKSVKEIVKEVTSEPTKDLSSVSTEELTKELVSRLPESMKPLAKPLEFNKNPLKLTGDALNLMLDYQHLENCIKSISLESQKLMPERARAALYKKGEEVIGVITVFNTKFAINSTILIKGGKNNEQTVR